MPTWLRAIVLIVSIGVGLRLFGMDSWQVYDAARSRLARATADTGDLVSGRYSERTAERLRVEAANRIRAEAEGMPAEVTGAESDNELRRELAAERKRILEEKAQQTERAVSLTLHGDLKGLKRQVEENARLAGGAPRRRRRLNNSVA